MQQRQKCQYWHFRIVCEKLDCKQTFPSEGIKLAMKPMNIVVLTWTKTCLHKNDRFEGNLTN